VTTNVSRAPVVRQPHDLRIAPVMLFCTAQVLLWSVMCGLTYSAPEVDSAEQFVWAFSMENGYWKHPPLPSWIMHALMQIFGPSVTLPFVATQVCIVGALAVTWRLGCEFMSPTRSLVAMMLTSLVTYHNIGGDSFNHNTVLLPFQAATLLMFYLATRRQAWHLWALTGLFAGLAMLVKYVALVPLGGLLLYFVLDRSLHTRRQLFGFLLAFAVFGCVLLPNWLWLRSTNFLPFRYAHEVTRELPGAVAAMKSVAAFVAMQLVRISPFLFGMGVLAWRSREKISIPAVVSGVRRLNRSDKLFVWTAALTPLLVTIAIGLFSETALQARWGANAFLLIGMLAMVLWQRPDSAAMLGRCVQIVVVMQILLCFGQTFGKTVLAEHFGRRTRANFPGAELALRARETWAAHTGVPLRLVVSDIWLGGNIVAHSPRRLAVLIDGYVLRSPWVRDEAVDRCGALILDDTTEDGAGHAVPNPALDALMARAKFVGSWTLAWAHPQMRADAPERGLIRWGIIPPSGDGTCEL
jgi:4-amino-4-deoxy-L-arabinose transferase-like glycosyltransferase